MGRICLPSSYRTPSPGEKPLPKEGLGAPPGGFPHWSPPRPPTPALLPGASNPLEEEEPPARVATVLPHVCCSPGNQYSCEYFYEPVERRTMYLSSDVWAYVCLRTMCHADAQYDEVHSLVEDLVGATHPALLALVDFVLAGGQIEDVLPPPPIRRGYVFTLKHCLSCGGCSSETPMRQPHF